jgi:cell division protein FtsB
VIAYVNRHSERPTPKLNTVLCTEAKRIFTSELEPRLQRLGAMVGEDYFKTSEIHDAAAELLHSVAVAFTWADDYGAASEILDRAEAWTRVGSPLASKIVELREQIQQSLRRNAVFAGSKPPDNPTLATVNGIGATFYGSSAFDPATNSHLTTLYFVFLFLPIFPIARYRVVRTESNRYQILAKYPLSRANWLHAAIGLIVVIGFIVYLSISSSADNVRVARVAVLKQQVESGRSQMKSLEDKATKEKADFEALRSELDESARTLKEMENEPSIAADTYETLRQKHNESVDRYNVLRAQLKADVDAYEALATKDKALVDEYNALVRR